MSRKQIRLGEAEEAVLERLVARGGVWGECDQPLWDNRHWTLQVLNSLARKQLVAEQAEGKYVATDKGSAVAKEGEFPILPAETGDKNVHFTATGLRPRAVNMTRR